MSVRLTFAARIGLIVVFSFLAAWIGSLALFYLSRSGDQAPVQPLPAQITAITEAVEQAPPAQRDSVLRAIRSETLAARLEPGEQVETTRGRLWLRLATWTLEDYLKAVGGRPLSIRRPKSPGPWKRPALEFRVGLRTGQTLIIDAHSVYLANFFGFPVGFTAGLLGTLVALIALYLLHRETRPLARLAAAVDQLDLSALPAPLPKPRSSAPEIRAVVEAFDRLQNRLAQLMMARLAMLGGISHDVRTFATRLRLRLEEMPESPRRERAIADIGDMIHLLDDALLASRAGADELSRELVELSEVVRSETADRQAAIAVTVSPEAENAAVLGDRLALKRVVANLIDNALRYGNRVEISVKKDLGELELAVDDNGPGIPPDRREILLEPFVRLESSRNRETGGAGLGLAIVRNLVEAQGGFVSVEDSPIGGARLVVRLPLFEPS